MIARRMNRNIPVRCRNVNDKMNSDLMKIKKLYGENMAHLCRRLFSTILEVPGLLVKLMTDTFDPSHLIYDDVYKKWESFQEYIIKLSKESQKEEMENKARNNNRAR